MITTLASTHPITATTWQIDPQNSIVTFSVQKRLLLWRYPVHGRFTEFEGSIELDSAAPEHSEVTATIQAASIDTGNRFRDRHLRGRHFLNVERSPAITFEGDTVTAVDPDTRRYRIDGNLTMHGVSRAVSLDTSLAPDQHAGLERLRFTAVTTIDRRDFGLRFSSPVIGIGNQVTIKLEVEAVRR
jgi:polyisoprenoid-binding protein YceI